MVSRTRQLACHDDGSADERAAHLGVTLQFGGAELSDAVEPLWLSLFNHHEGVGAAGLPMVDRAMSWRRRKALYESLLVKPNSFLLLATRDEIPVGYVLAHVHRGINDTWPTGSRVGEIESLVVLPTERGAGLGSLLLDVAEQRLADDGIKDIMLRVVVGNLAALRFYERRGMAAVATTMLRLGPRQMT